MTILYENYTTTSTSELFVMSNRLVAQVFTVGATSHNITSVKLLISKQTGFVADTYAKIYSVDGSDLPDDTGGLATSVVVSAANIPLLGSEDWVEFQFSTPPNLSSENKYAIVLVPDADAKYIYWRYDNANGYADGEAAVRNGSWGTSAGNDCLFQVYGGEISLLDKQYSKKLVAIGNNEIWYQTDSTTMAELADANNAISTVNPLTAFEAFQKLFIANKTKLQVADFTNSLITTADISTNPPIKGTILTGGTSSAVMVTDYIDASSGATNIYGHKTSITTFISGETVTGTNSTAAPYGTAVSFVLNTNEVAGPHWYDWTPYANDTNNFGEMPASAYISCRYRGRCVLSGHPNYPHQWYMSRVADPWDWAYGETDPLTAVAANNADAGEIGDIVSAMIPYGDDFLVFGCATSIHILTGDPAFSGQIDELDSTTGIFGPRSWCKDDKGNLYFWGANGLYLMTGGREKPINLSDGHLPKLVSTWAVNPTVHRVVLSYDPLNQGVIISRTTMADGENLNYFFDLQTQGFYPETYPKECGIYSNTFYDSDSLGTKGMILGCKDGYLRKFTYSAKDDDIGATNEAISSYFTLAMIDMNEEDNSEGKLTSLTVVVGGGASGGAHGDSDAVSYDICVADDAETCLENIKDGATPIETGTFTGTGRFRIRTRLRGKWLGLKFYNNTVSETFVINLIAGDIIPAGQI